MNLSNDYKTARIEIWVTHSLDCMAEQRAGKNTHSTLYELEEIFNRSDLLLENFDKRFSPHAIVDLETKSSHELDILGVRLQCSRTYSQADKDYREELKKAVLKMGVSGKSQILDKDTFSIHIPFMEGKELDEIGEIFGINRNGKTDIEYREKLCAYALKYHSKEAPDEK